jgi:hypothetical protein
VASTAASAQILTIQTTMSGKHISRIVDVDHDVEHLLSAGKRKPE